MRLELRGYRHRTVTAPESLVAAPMQSAVALNWALQPEEPTVTGYRLFKAPTVSGSYSQCGSTAAPPVTVMSLTNAQTYWYKVAGYTESDALGEFAGPVPCAPSSSGQSTQAEAVWQPRSLSAQLAMIWGMPRPKLTWLPQMAAPAGSCYNIYRTQVSTGPFALAATRTQPGSGPVSWIDYGTTRAAGRVYYEVTYYDPASGFESWPSAIVWVDL